MKYTICSHSIYKGRPENPLDDLSCNEFKSLINKFDITFDDGYRSIYEYGRILFKNVKTPESMLKLGEIGLKNHIKSIGLFNTKAQNVIKLSQMLINEHPGKKVYSTIGNFTDKNIDFALNKNYNDEDSIVEFLEESADPQHRHLQPIHLIFYYQNFLYRG